MTIDFKAKLAAEFETMDELIADAKLKATGASVHNTNVLSAKLANEKLLFERDHASWPLGRLQVSLAIVRMWKYELNMLRNGKSPAEAKLAAKRFERRLVRRRKS